MLRPARAAGSIRIGYQKYGSLVLLKGRGTLEKALQPLGTTVAWSEFPSGPPLLEALNAGAIDFGSAGEAPPIFAQAASPELRYVATEPPAPRGEAILVPKDSPVRSVADLRGKTIALNKGSNVHFLLVRALERAGLPYDAVKLAFLAPADANAAFVRGSVDAWVIWDPYLAAAERATGARVLADGQGIAPNREFYLSRRAFTESSPEIVSAVIAAIGSIDAWAEGHADTVAAELAPAIGVPAPVLQVALERQSYGAAPLDATAIADQQRVADAFHTLGLLPKPIRVADAVWTQPERRAESR
jgi:sulfonate transport system substrate-binding protein